MTGVHTDCILIIPMLPGSVQTCESGDTCNVSVSICVAIAARAPFEGVTTFVFLPSMRVASEIQSWGGGVSNVKGESLSCQLHFRSARKTTTTTKKKCFCPRQFKVERSV